MSYEQRVYSLRSNFDIGGFGSKVGNWVNRRPALKYHNSLGKNHEVMVVKNIPGEIEEARIERERYGTPEYSAKAEKTESLDILFFIFSVASAKDVEIDLFESRRRANGYGKRSDIFERLTESSTNMSENQLPKDLEHLTSLWIAYFADVPSRYSVPAILHVLFDKNVRNYPEYAFPDSDPVTHVLFKPDELEDVYVHGRQSMKEIRNFKRETLGLRNRDYGLFPGDADPYIQYITNFARAEEAFANLKRQLYADHQLELSQLVV